MKKKQYWILVPMGLILLALSPYLCISIRINGSTNMEIAYGEEYQEEGASARFLNTPLNVSVIGHIDTQKLGTQELIYQVKNQLGIIKKKKRIVKVVDKVPPVITLTGGNSLTILLGTEYQDPGYVMIDNCDGDISKKVKMKNSLDTNKVGTYEIFYEGQDQSGNRASAKRTVTVIEKFSYKSSYDEIDNTVSGWYTGNKKNGVRPVAGAGATEEELKPYQAYYMGRDEKILYLTFDEGSNDTYLEQIIDVLNQNDVKATIFLCKNFIRDHPNLIKKMVDTGHSIGNHTHNHETMTNYANQNQFDTYLKEIQSVEEIFFEVTGKQMDKVYREPRGEWSYRSLQIMKDLGYSTYFWSATYKDFAGDVSKEEALQKMIQQKHNGAIYLLHPKNKGNYEAMDEFIKEMKKQGYSFGLVKDIP